MLLATRTQRRCRISSSNSSRSSCPAVHAAIPKPRSRWVAGRRARRSSSTASRAGLRLRSTWSRGSLSTLFSTLPRRALARGRPMRTSERAGPPPPPAHTHTSHGCPASVDQLLSTGTSQFNSQSIAVQFFVPFLHGASVVLQQEGQEVVTQGQGRRWLRRGRR